MNLALMLGGLLMTAAPSPTAQPVYLDESVTGARYCLNPDSPVVRKAFTGGKPTPDQKLEGPALAEDVRFLHRLLRTTYSGYPELLQHRTFDPDAFFESWRAKVAARPTLTLEEGVLQPLVQLRQAVTDHHLGPDRLMMDLADDPRLAFYEYQAEPPAGLKLEACKADALFGAQADTLQVRPVLRTDGSRRQAVSLSVRGAGASVTLACGETTLTLHKRPAPPRPPDPKEHVYTYQPLGDVGVITLRNFKGPPAALEQLRQFVADYPKHRQHALLVFDLRGNNGGDDFPMYAWLEQAVRGTWQGNGALWVQGAFHPCFSWNHRVRRQIQDGRVDLPEALAERQKLSAQWTGRPVPSRHEFFSGLVSGEGKEPFTGRIVVLVDRNSLSSGESAAFALHRATGAPLVGERTGGFTQYGNAPSFVLPRTGLGWVVPTKRNYHGAQVEGVGHPVDLYLDEPRRPVTELLPALRTLGQPAPTP
jgi:hypothetical protein